MYTRWLPCIRVACVLTSMTALGGCGSPTKPSDKGDTQGDSGTVNSAKSFVGCYAAGTNLAGVGCGVVTTLGNAFADSRFFSEIQIQSAFWQGIPATVFVINECSPQQKNAYAAPDGVIRFGLYLHNDLVAQYPDGLPVAGVLAHEWGHEVQFAYSWMNPNQSTVKPTELEADAFAGYYMGLAKLWAWSNITSFFNAVFNLGDYNFNSPQHHGTPQERLAAARLGFDTAFAASSSGRLLNYTDLHFIFSSNLPRAVLAVTPDGQSLTDASGLLSAAQLDEVREIASGRTTGSERRVPGTAATLRRLYPRR
jgi:hypothetical protein